MPTLREYYEKDFGHSTKMHVKIPFNTDYLEGIVNYDFSSFSAFLSIYIPKKDRGLQYFKNLLSTLKYGETQFKLDGKITLPSAKEFPGFLNIENKEDFEIKARFFGESEWISTKNIIASRRIFIYSESNLSEAELKDLKLSAKELGHDLQFRSDNFILERSKIEKPMAFICHDSRDKPIAAQIAIDLQKMLCPVWYDDFSLKVGDNLRKSIEKGLQECKKCVLVLSKNFLSNAGWTQTEFDSIFTRELIEEKNFVLPVWVNVSKEEVFRYSPSLANKVGIKWANAEEVVRKLFQAIDAN